MRVADSAHGVVAKRRRGYGQSSTVARAKGLPVAEGNVLDREGRPTTDPHDFYAGGALLPFGGHKGSGFSLLAQFLGRGLAGLQEEARIDVVA